ncbi:MAG: lysophospholipase [Deltaproteobacteria bacterium]|nr:lysophospholipase [Deltaproteobacteria bacterium]
MKHKEGHFIGFKDYNIYFQCWLPKGDIKAVLLVAHGFAEHSGRYGNLVHYFVHRNFSVYALDHRGHGKSDGERTQVDHFTDYISDLKTFFDIIREDNPDEEIFLIGHSMGAGISTAYALEYQNELAGLMLSGGGIITREMFEKRMITGKPLETSGLSRDQAVIDAYDNDPLVYRGPIMDRSSINESRELLSQKSNEITLPILIMAGANPMIDDAKRSKALYDLVKSKDKTLMLYDNLLHEIFNEPEHEQVMSDMEKWIIKHL